MTTEQKVFSIISEILGIPESNITKKDKLADIVNDSIQLFELLIRFEKELGEKIKYEDIVNIECVNDIIMHAYKKGYSVNGEFRKISANNISQILNSQVN